LAQLLHEDNVWVSLGNAMKAKQSLSKAKQSKAKQSNLKAKQNRATPSWPSQREITGTNRRHGAFKPLQVGNAMSSNLTTMCGFHLDGSECDQNHAMNLKAKQPHQSCQPATFESRHEPEVRQSHGVCQCIMP
jgi:hypothetical protein